jgi:hypothetical protein
MPPSLMVPLTVVLRLLSPTMSVLAPRLYVPAPSIEPAVTRLLPAGPLVPEKSTTPPALVMKRATAPVLVPEKIVCPNALVMMMASSAVLALLNCRVPSAPETPLTTKVGALPEMSATPSPWITSEEGTPLVPVMLNV